MNLQVHKREKLGKRVKTLRKQGLIPAELYGRGLANVHLSVPVKEFTKIFQEAGENTVINVVVENKKRPVLVHDTGRNYFTGEIDHVDFYEVRMDEKIKARVPLVFSGEAPAVKDKSGILNKAISEVEVEALPADLPRRLEVDLSVLDNLNKSVYVKDIKVPKGVHFAIGPETVIVTVTPPLAEEIKAEEPIDMSAVKVETEEKKTERAAAKEAKPEESGKPAAKAEESGKSKAPAKSA